MLNYSSFFTEFLSSSRNLSSIDILCINSIFCKIYRYGFYWHVMTYYVMTLDCMSIYMNCMSLLPLNYIPSIDIKARLINMGIIDRIVSGLSQVWIIIVLSIYSDIPWLIYFFFMEWLSSHRPPDTYSQLIYHSST